ncbi:MAG: hypothetical protein ACREE0_13880 [Phenylobacterium sp.]
MRWLLAARLVGGILLGAGPVAAAGPLGGNLNPSAMAWFYNRPGVTPAVLADDQRACAVFAQYVAGSLYSELPDGTGFGGLIGVLLEGGLNAGPRAGYLDDCMISNGYRRFNIAETKLAAFAERFNAMTPAIQAEFVGAESPPEGVLARQWVNVYWWPAQGEAALAPTSRRSAPRGVRSTTFDRPKRLIIDPVVEGTTLAPGPAEAVVAVTLRSNTPKPALLHFMRDLEETGAPDLLPVKSDTQWPTIQVKASAGKTGAETVTRRVFVVPAGTYSLASVGTGGFEGSTLFCLGTLAFRVEPGDVVDLGEFTVQPGMQVVHPLAPTPKLRLRIDRPPIEAARQALTSSSADLAGRMKAATFRNDFPHECPATGGFSVYGFDSPGAATWRAAGGK